MTDKPKSNVLPFRTPEQRKADEAARMRAEARARILAYAKTLPPLK